MAFPIVQRRGSIVPPINPQDFVVDVAGAVEDLGDTISEVSRMARANRQQDLQNRVTERKLDVMERQSVRADEAHGLDMKLGRQDIQIKAFELERAKEKAVKQDILDDLELETKKLEFNATQRSHSKEMLDLKQDTAILTMQNEKMEQQRMSRGVALDQEIDVAYGMILDQAIDDNDVDAVAEVQREIRNDFGDRLHDLPRNSRFRQTAINQALLEDARAGHAVSVLKNQQRNAEELTAIGDEERKLRKQLLDKAEKSFKTGASMAADGFKPDARPEDLHDSDLIDAAMIGYYENLQNKARVAGGSKAKEFIGRTEVIDETRFVAERMINALQRGQSPSRWQAAGGGKEVLREWDHYQNIKRHLTSDNDADRRVGMAMLNSHTADQNSRVESRFAKARRVRASKEAIETIPVERRLAEIETRKQQLLSANGNRREIVQRHITERRAPQGQAGAAGTATVPTVRTQADFDRLNSGDLYINGETGDQVRKP